MSLGSTNFFTERGVKKHFLGRIVPAMSKRIAELLITDRGVFSPSPRKMGYIYITKTFSSRGRRYNRVVQEYPGIGIKKNVILMMKSSFIKGKSCKPRKFIGFHEFPEFRKEGLHRRFYERTMERNPNDWFIENLKEVCDLTRIGGKKIYSFREALEQHKLYTRIVSRSFMGGTKEREAFLDKTQLRYRKLLYYCIWIYSNEYFRKQVMYKAREAPPCYEQ